MSKTQAITSLIESFSSFFLLGPPGIGKTSLITSLLPFDPISIKLNCLQHKKKSSLYAALWSNIYEYIRSKKSLKLESVAHCKLLHLIDLLDRLPAKFLIILDNFHKLDNPAKTLTELIHLTKLFQVAFIFIGLSLPPQTSSHLVSLLPKIYLPLPDDSLLISILKSSLLFTSEIASEKQLNTFLMDFVKNFRDITNSDLHLLTSLAIKILPFYLQDSKKYQLAKKLLLEKPLSTEMELKIALEDKKWGGVTPPSPKISKMGSILLFACFIGCSNPEKSDKIVLKDYHKSGRRAISLRTAEKKGKRLALHRLIAISQSLMSVWEDKENWNLMQEELGKTDQSIDFYKELNTLVEEGWVGIARGSEEVNEWKYYCLVGREEVDRMAEENGFEIGKYLVE